MIPLLKLEATSAETPQQKLEVPLVSSEKNIDNGGTSGIMAPSKIEKESRTQIGKESLLFVFTIYFYMDIERTWVDRVLDAIVCENDGPESKFALICANCFNHNGLVLPAEYSTASKVFC